jgi:hypothetical protein
VIPLAVEGNSAVIVGIRIVGFEVDSFIEVPDSALVVAFVNVCDSAIDQDG